MNKHQKIAEKNVWERYKAASPHIKIFQYRYRSCTIQSDPKAAIHVVLIL